jgi:aryl-alcohol dehydrogenase-like predicted oxidoreductase
MRRSTPSASHDSYASVKKDITNPPALRVYPVNPGDHSPKKLRSIFLTSLQHLKRDKVRVLYLHAPDRSVPFEDTAREINNLYKEGRL